MRRSPTEAEIESRAQELYEQAGRPEGPVEGYLEEARAQLEAAEAEAETMDIAPGIESKHAT